MRYALIWNIDTGFIKLEEGNGSNLLVDEMNAGYKDYITIYDYEYDGYELTRKCEYETQILLKEFFEELFSSADEVIDFVIEKLFIPNVEYQILSTNI